MKKTIATVMIALSTTLAHGATICTITKESKAGSMEYDKTVYQGEVSSGLFLVQQSHGFESLDMSNLSEAEWKKLDKKTVVTFSTEEDDQAGITIGQVNMASPENLLKIKAIGFGKLVLGSYVGVIAPQQGLSVACAKY